MVNGGNIRVKVAAAAGLLVFSHLRFGDRKCGAAKAAKDRIRENWPSLQEPQIRFIFRRSGTASAGKGPQM